MESNIRSYRKNRRNSIELGYIAIPTDVDRDNYVETCLKTERVSILTINGEFILKALIDKSVLQTIEFPQNSEELGSSVVLITEPYRNQAIIVGVLNRGDDSSCVSENQFLLRKKTDDFDVSIIGDSKNGNLNISVESNLDTGGDINIDILNKSNSSNFNLSVAGNVNLNIVGDTTILNKGTVKIDSEVEIINGAENLNRSVLGDMLMNEFVNPLFDALEKMVLTTPAGPSTAPPVNWTEFLQIKNVFEEKVLSKLNKLE